ncbi:uncharacterized protein B0J16DRAFT_345534 [Fusarium flagelliforme]|uniref:Infection structure specific protein n=1 Tax=Fusarium flagelliforme TaxID=2675880 RepID=A0A395M8Z6_9HYPO|nr:uncharacterized protein B0J16DRAFT_345534 [Fusarium flagelliforme]KAH7183194.1 hypothetical protein B0J16DRAFT_345534 [Fusarium flagelliforme]RFN43539.1 hypothetical protein FIE12Z_12225 [Fusarium flagelliforme]
MTILKFVVLSAFASTYAAAQTPTPTPTSPPTTTSLTRPSLTLPACWSLKDSLPITGAPAPPMDMSELGVSFALGSLYNTADPCQLPAITGSSAEEFSEWASEWTSWQAQHVSEYRILWESCSDEPYITDLVPVGPDACSTLKAKITGTASAGDSGDKDKKDEEKKDGDAPEKVEDSSASRVMASVLAAMVVVGVLGAAV